MLPNNPNTLIILAAGASSRMRQSLEQQGSNLSSFSSKALIPLGKEGKPAIEMLIQNAIKAGIQRILLVVPEASEAFRAYFDNKIYEETSIAFAIQKVPSGRQKPLGTADAVLQCMEQYPDLKHGTYLVCNGDNFYSVEAFSALLSSKHKNALIGYDRNGLDFPMERIAAFALLRLDEKKRLVSIMEKPTPEELLTFQQVNEDLLVSMNLWKFEGASLYPYLLNCPLDPVRNEKELPTAVLNMIHSGEAEVHILTRKEHVPDLTSADDIEKVTAYLRRQKP